jgi:hypothetical protein
MSSSKPSNKTGHFWILSIVTVILSAALLASLWPVALGYARDESRRLSGDAKHTGSREAEVDYHLAYRLDHSNADAALHFASAQLAANQPRATLDTLAMAGEGSAVRQTRLKAYLELGQTGEAITIADSLVGPGASEADIANAALAYGVGEQGSAIQPLEARVTAPEALQRLKRAEAGNLPLAAELYAAGLLRSSSTLLMKQPASAERSLLLARINFQRHTAASLAEAADYYRSVVALDPSSQTARAELITTLRDLGRTTDADAQQALLKKLQAGKP